jgi:hypothetical protein
MNDKPRTVHLRCWLCGTAFEAPYRRGQRPRYCGMSCKRQAEKIRRRLAYERQAEAERTRGVVSVDTAPETPPTEPPVDFHDLTPNDLRRY